jgi:hypothetical protein
LQLLPAAAIPGNASTTTPATTMDDHEPKKKDDLIACLLLYKRSETRLCSPTRQAASSIV